MKKGIVMAGSVNQDIIIATPRLPKLGETITGNGFASASGGKGANQAVAAARLGGKVSMIAAVGDDEPGRRMKDSFEADGIDTTYVKTISGKPTGTAVILLCGGDNCIVIDPGANHAVTPDMIDTAEPLIASAGLLMLQMEIPFETVTHAIRLARKHNTPVLLNPAPAVKLNDDLLRQIDILTPNESECALLTGTAVESIADAQEAAAALMKRGVRQVMITMGEQGVVYNDGQTVCHQPAQRVADVVDTTAAGDCFSAAVAVALTEGVDIRGAVRFASAASALTVMKKGAQPSLPHRAEVEALLIN